MEASSLKVGVRVKYRSRYSPGFQVGRVVEAPVEDGEETLVKVLRGDSSCPISVNVEKVLEVLPEPVVTYTTAPKDYDWFGTVELDPYVATTTGGGRAKTIRKVESPAGEVDNMRDRYMSGLHMAVNETEWKKLVAYKLVELRPSVAKAPVAHTRDEDCTVGADGCCTGCGVSHTGTCDCGGRGFHRDGCESREAREAV